MQYIADSPPLEYDIKPFLLLRLWLLNKESLCVYLRVCMSTLIVLASSQDHSDTSDCTQRSGEIGVDKNASYVTTETR